MLVTIACLKNEHSPLILLLAILLCVTASLSAMGLLKPSVAPPGVRISARLMLPACVIGVGIWATHFVAMLAYRPPVPIAYDRALTVLSLALSVALVAASLWVAKRRPRYSPPSAGPCSAGRWG